MLTKQYQRRPDRKWACALLPIFAWLLIMTGQNGLSHLYAIQARHDVDIWLKTPSTQPVEHYDRAHRNITAALQMDPGNPSLHEDLGRLLDAGASRLTSLSPAQRTQAWQDSAAAFRTAIALRPVSPYAWADLAIIKSRQNAWDAETQHALKQAAHFGPWEPSVQRAIADVGWSGWHAWPNDLRAILVENVARGGKHQRESMLHLILQHGQQNEACMNPRLFQTLHPPWCG